MQELEREQKYVLANRERCTEGDIYFYCESLGAPDDLFKGKKSSAAEVLTKWLDNKMQELGVSSKSELWHFYRTEYVD